MRMLYPDIEMSWKPLGLSITYADFEEILVWYILKHSLDSLNTAEVTNNAYKLYS